MNVKDPGHGWLIIGELWSWGRVVSFIIQKVNISIHNLSKVTILNLKQREKTDGEQIR